MVKSSYGVRNYTCSEKTKRPQKCKIDSEKMEKRNSRQRHLYITLDNIDELFSNDYEDKWPVCYNMIFNLIQGKVTKYFTTRSYDRKKEISYDCINRLYSVLKRKLLKMNEQSDSKKGLFFYLSQFFRYVELVVYSTVFYGTQDQKYLIQEPENFVTDDVLQEDISYYEDDYVLPCAVDQQASIEYENAENKNGDLFDKIIGDNSTRIKMCIDSNESLDSNEKQALFRLYKSCYSNYSDNSLNKRDKDIIQTLRLRMDYEPELLKDLQEILEDGTWTSIKD